MRFFLIIAAVYLPCLQAQSIVSPLIKNEQISLLNQYQLDFDFLQQFSFAEYRVVSSAGQGDFYIDRDDCIKRVLEFSQVWEPEIVDLIKKHVKPNTIAVDIGAHIGTHTIMMSKCVQEEGLVIAFEPQAKIHRELVMNLKLNGCKNVVPVWSALGKEQGIAYLEPVRPKNEGYRSISSKRPTEQIFLTTLDSFELTSVSCIKIDVESYELEVLQGAFKTIMDNRPVIIIEIGGGWSREEEEGINPKEHLKAVIEVLENTFQYDVTTISEISGDYLAIPKERNFGKEFK